MADHRNAAEESETEMKFSGAKYILVCIHGMNEKGIYGKLVNFYLKNPVDFDGAGDLVLKADMICDQLETPELSAEAVENLLDGRRNLIYPEAMQAKELLDIYIDCRRHFSLQGRIRGRMTEGHYINFRSALELLKMLELIKIS